MKNGQKYLTELGDLYARFIYAKKWSTEQKPYTTKNPALYQEQFLPVEIVEEYNRRHSENLPITVKVPKKATFTPEMVVNALKMVMADS